MNARALRDTVYIHADESCLGNQFSDRATPGGAAGLVDPTHRNSAKLPYVRSWRPVNQLRVSARSNRLNPPVTKNLIQP